MMEDPAIARLGLAQGKLLNQVAVVTGGGRGIGRETARALSWLGARVVIAELSDEGAETESWIKSLGGAALFIKTDVSSAEGVEALVRKTREAFGPAEILINNAALCPVSPVLEMTADLWDRVQAVNLRGTFLTCKAFLPDMLARGRGTIVNLISAEAMPGLAAYIASKQGITGFSQSLALEVGERGVRVVAFGPGMVDTPAIRAVAPDLAPRLGFTVEQFLHASLHPAYDGLMPAEHAGAAAAYLAAELAGEFHGETVTGYEVLERAGLIQPARMPDETGAPAGIATPPAGGGEPDLARLIARGRRLREIVAGIEADFAKLPAFVRPMARAGFKGRAGQSLQDWARTAAGLAGILERAAGGEAAAQAELRVSSPRLTGLLGKLIVYLQGVPAETARFTKDAEFLREVKCRTDEQAAEVRALVKDLERISARE